VAIFRDHPWRGTGPGTFGSIYPSYKTSATEPAQLVHNDFLQMGSDAGVVSLLAYAALWVVALLNALQVARQRTSDLAAAAICGSLAAWVTHGLLDFDLYVPGTAWPAFLLLGSLQGLKVPPKADAVAASWRVRMFAGVVCVGIVVVIALREGRSLLADFAYGRAVDARESNPSLALAELEHAIAVCPENAHYRAAAGDAALTLGRWEEAAGQYRSAVDRDPYRAGYHWRLGRALCVGGKTKIGLEQIREAIALDPTNQRYQSGLRDSCEKSVRQPPVGLLEFAPVW